MDQLDADQADGLGGSVSTVPPGREEPAHGNGTVVVCRKNADVRVSVGARFTGCLVTAVDQDGAAARAGVLPGWLLVELSGRRTTSAADVTLAFARAPPLLRAHFIAPLDDDEEGPRRCPYCRRSDFQDLARHVALCSMPSGSPEMGRVTPVGLKLRGLLQGLDTAARGVVAGGQRWTDGALAALESVCDDLLHTYGLVHVRRARRSSAGSDSGGSTGSSSSDGDSSDSGFVTSRRQNRRGRAAANGILACAGDVSERPLRRMKQLFTARLRGCSGGIGIPDAVFTEHFAPIVCTDPRADPATSDPATRSRVLREFTTKIDTDANGLVDWEEFSSFLLTRTQEGLTDAGDYSGTLYIPHSASVERQPLPGTHAASAPHKVNAHRIIAPRSSQTVDKYYTASADGTVKSWSAHTLAYDTTVHNDTTDQKSGFIVDLACLPISNRLLVAQVDRTLTLYDAASGALHKVYKGFLTRRGERGTVGKTKPFLEDVQSREQRRRDMLDIDQDGGQKRRDQSHLSAEKRLTPCTKQVAVLPVVGMDNSPLCCEAVQPDLQRKLFPSLPEPVLFGCDQGYVQLYNMRPGTGSDEHGGLRRAEGHSWRPHESWVTRVVPCGKLEALLTSSTDQFLNLTNLEKGETIQSLGGPGVLCSATTLDGRPRQSAIYGFDYSADEYDVIATYGASRSVMFWRPSMQNPVERVDHKAPVVGVRFNPSVGHCVVLTRDKMITVYDLRTFRVLDQIEDKQRRAPDNFLSALDIDERRHCVLAAANCPIAYRFGAATVGSPPPPPLARMRNSGHSRSGHQADGEAPPEQPPLPVAKDVPRFASTHNGPVIAVLHNVRFGHLVTVDSKRLFVWDAGTGEKVSSWSPSAEAVQGGLTAAGFDCGRRRVATATQEGRLAFWNYVTGEQLKELRNPHAFALTCVQHAEVTGAATDVSALLVAAGWSSKILFFVDNAGEYYAPLHRVVTLSAELGHVYSIARAGNRLAFGMEHGQVVIYDAATMCLISTLPVLVDTPCSGIQRRLSSASAPTHRRQSRHSFADTYVNTHGNLSCIVEQVCMLSHNAAVSLHGSGVVVVWRTGHRGASEAVAAFRGSWQLGDEAFALAVAMLQESGRGGRGGDDGSGRIWVGDASGVVSLFEAKEAIAAAKEQQKRPLHGGFGSGRGLPPAPSMPDSPTCSPAPSMHSSPERRIPPRAPGDVPHIVPPSATLKRFGAQADADAASVPPASLKRAGSTHSLAQAELLAVSVNEVTLVACAQVHREVVTAMEWMACCRLLVVSAGDGAVHLITARCGPVAVVGRTSNWALVQVAPELDCASDTHLEPVDDEEPDLGDGSSSDGSAESGEGGTKRKAVAVKVSVVTHQWTGRLQMLRDATWRDKGFVRRSLRSSVSKQPPGSPRDRAPSEPALKPRLTVHSPRSDASDASPLAAEEVYSGGTPPPVHAKQPCVPLLALSGAAPAVHPLYPRSSPSAAMKREEAELRAATVEEVEAAAALAASAEHREAAAIQLLTPRPPSARLGVCCPSPTATQGAPAPPKSAPPRRRRPATAGFTRGGLRVKNFRERARECSVAFRHEMKRLVVRNDPGTAKAIRLFLSDAAGASRTPFALPPRPQYSAAATAARHGGGSEISNAELSALVSTRSEPWTRRTDFLPRETQLSRPPCFLGERVRQSPRDKSSAAAAAAGAKEVAGLQTPTPSTGLFFHCDRKHAEEQRTGGSALGLGGVSAPGQLVGDAADRWRSSRTSASARAYQTDERTLPRTNITTTKPFADVLCTRRAGCMGGVHSASAHRLPHDAEVCKGVTADKHRRHKGKDDFGLDLYIKFYEGT